MIDSKKLVSFYLEQFRNAYNKSTGRASMPKYVSRINAKAESMAKVHMHPGMEKQCTQLHGEVKRLAFAAYAGGQKSALNRVKQEIIPDLVRIDLELFTEQEAEWLDESLIKPLRKGAPGAICNKPLVELYRNWRAANLREEIVSLVPSRPETEFPEALEMHRHFILHIGPTNSGKTYQSLERLKGAQRGVYLGPLRLLALEVYETMKEAGIACTMLTGQECIEEPDSHIMASTIEMLDMDVHYDIAVIDEAQMVTDEMRGHQWTRAILGIRADEIHVCMSSDAVKAVTHLIALTGDDYETHEYERKTPLVMEDRAFVFPDDVQEGDALIAFSKKAVLDVAGRLEASGITSSVIYGSLPPEIRRKQTQMFYSGETKVVVSTDAIGMGLNLPVRRIVFMAAEKYDGRRQRALTVSEIKQIAGRAGRYKIHEVGYVTAMDEKRRRFIAKQLPLQIPEIRTVSLGFPQVLLNMDAPLDEILKLWHDQKPEPPFEKINIDEMLFLYNEAYKNRMFIADFDDKFMLYRMITCPIDLKDREVIDLWNQYCTSYTADVSLARPSLRRSRHEGLMRLESYYKKLDLYYQFSYRMGKWINEPWLAREREKTQDAIMQQLSQGKNEYILRCKYCGRVLPVDSPYRVCSRCHREREGRY